ncbi:hypothetical protein [uncultured Dialister sp.]|uniref:hypothetical protein n=1 Tax=uncultured Dialister sp. TaxID=278064 RepID=UPI0026002570|nr:hypothetical protein [uncultured Dialister sp.]
MVVAAYNLYNAANLITRQQLLHGADEIKCGHSEALLINIFAALSNCVRRTFIPD